MELTLPLIRVQGNRVLLRRREKIAVKEAQKSEAFAAISTLGIFVFTWLANLRDAKYFERYFLEYLTLIGNFKTKICPILFFAETDASFNTALEKLDEKLAFLPNDFYAVLSTEETPWILILDDIAQIRDSITSFDECLVEVLTLVGQKIQVFSKHKTKTIYVPFGRRNAENKLISFFWEGRIFDLEKTNEEILQELSDDTIPRLRQPRQTTQRP